MESTCDVFLTNLPKNISEVVVKNLFSSAGKVLKVKIIDDKRNDNQKLCFVGFGTMDEALEAVRIADKSDAFGEPIRASISKKCLEGLENNVPSRNNFRENNSRPQFNAETSPNNRLTNGGRGRGLQSKTINSPISFKNNDVKLTDIKLRLKELIEVEIIELSEIDYFYARPIEITVNSKIEIVDLLSKVNACQSTLIPVEFPKINDYYLAKWDDECYYRAELLEILDGNKYKVTFVDEGTTGDIVQDIKYIPNGPLQQYPKQFLKLSLGCPDDEKLKQFIIQESESKAAKIYWMGEFYDETIPLINFFLNEDEVVEKFIHSHKLHIRKKFSMNFEDLPINKLEENIKLTFARYLYKNPSDFVLLKDSVPVFLKNKKSPLVLPTPGDVCIYEKRNSNNFNLFRCIIMRRQLFSFDIQLMDTGEKINNVNIDNLYMPEDTHKINPPFSINCELIKSFSIDEDSLLELLSHNDVKFSIIDYKKSNRYIISYDLPIKQVFEYPLLNDKEFIGKSFKAVVSHAISPMNFYVQIDIESYAQDLNDIQEKININYKGSSFKDANDVEINQAIIAPFIVSGTDAEFFRAKVIEKRREKPEIHVLFVDYGNGEWVDSDKLLNIDESLVSKSGLAFHCQLDVDIRKEAWSHAAELFCQVTGFSDLEPSEFAMQVLKVNDDKFVVDLVSQMKGSVTNILQKSGTCTSTSNEKNFNKPVCNGDIAHNNVSISNGIHYDDETDNLDKINTKNPKEDLLRKVNDLERRLFALEKVIFSK